MVKPEPSDESAMKEGEETKRDGGWETADFMKQSECWLFYNSYKKK